MTIDSILVSNNFEHNDLMTAKNKSILKLNQNKFGKIKNQNNRNRSISPFAPISSKKNK